MIPSGCSEAGLFIPGDGGVLITTDALQNQVDAEGASLLARLVFPLMGFRGGLIVPPMWRRFQKVGPSALRDSFSNLTAHSFDTLVPGHGPPVLGGAAAKVKAVVEGLAAD